jgi:hypothetical protein
MAGGMVPGRGGRSLSERALNSGVEQPPPADPSPAVPSAAAPAEGRHCWVHDPPEAAGTWPGLLVEWRSHPQGWQGRVAYTVRGPHGPALVEAWLPAYRLEPR